jgi:hypothetical protein
MGTSPVLTRRMPHSYTGFSAQSVEKIAGC